MPDLYPGIFRSSFIWLSVACMGRDLGKGKKTLSPVKLSSVLWKKSTYLTFSVFRRRRLRFDNPHRLPFALAIAEHGGHQGQADGQNLSVAVGFRPTIHHVFGFSRGMCLPKK